jgi:hypothetical protein
MPRMRISEREFHTILAALRYYQVQGQSHTTRRPTWIEEIATNGGEVVALDADEIDKLCEQLNCGHRNG